MVNISDAGIAVGPGARGHRPPGQNDSDDRVLYDYRARHDLLGKTEMGPYFWSLLNHPI
jgi:hypothetical protein